MNAELPIAETIIASVPLHRLRPGHVHPSADINMRKTYSEAETRALADSILKEGIIQSLLVCPSPDVPLTDDSRLYVAAGGRRLAALTQLVNEGKISEAYPVPVTIEIGLSPAGALGKSMIENDVRVPPHPADRYEAFMALKEMGIAETAIAERFGVKEIQVRRALALGSLSPAIRDAWRQGEIDEDAARAFTLAPDAKTMDRLYARLKKKNALTAWQIRRELRPDNAETEGLLNFVGIDAYRAAGGMVHEDLFEGAHDVSDRVLLKAMANDILDRECERLKGAGWSWAAPVSALPADWRQWKKTEPLVEPTPEETARRETLEREAQTLRESEGDGEGSERWREIACEGTRIACAIRERGFNDAQRGKAGCALDITGEGELIIVHGVIRPGSAKPKKSKAPESAAATAPEADTPSAAAPDAPAKRRKDAAEQESAKEPARPSNGAVKWLSECLTDAARTLRGDPDLALALIIAAAAQGGAYKPLKLSVSGRGANDLMNLMASHRIEDNLAQLKERTRGEILELICRVAGAALDMTAENASSPPLKHDGAAAIADALGPALVKELSSSFDFMTWFDSVPKGVALAAIEEGLGAEHLARAKKLKAKEIAAYAAKNLDGTGWLPAELRTSHYRFDPGALPAGA